MSSTSSIAAAFFVGIAVGVGGTLAMFQPMPPGSNAPAAAAHSDTDDQAVQAADAPAHATASKKAKHILQVEPVGPLPPGEHPNVLILMWDTVRADRLSALGHTRQTTPWLEAFADQALVFEQAQSPSYWTVPSHASLFTGLPVSAHNTYTGRTWLANGHNTMPEHFRANGYDTWVFSANPNLTPRTNLVQGFNEALLSGRSPWREQAIAWNAQKVPKADASTDRSPAYTKPRPAHFLNLNKDAGPVASDAFFQWLDSRASDRPFFGFVNYMEAHYPRLPSMASREAILEPELLQSGLVTVAGIQRLGNATQGVGYFSEAEREAMLGVYDAAIRDLDNATKTLIDELDRRGMLDNTIVVVMSDHGEAFGEHQIYGHNFTLHSELTHVPLFIRYPSKLAPRRVEHPVSIADIYLTLSELAELPAPVTRLPLKSVTDAKAGDPAFSEFKLYNGWSSGIPLKKPDGSWYPMRRKQRSTRRGDYRSIAYTGGALQLYNVRTDPLEQDDLFGTQPELAKELDGLHQAWRNGLPAAGPLSAGERAQMNEAKESEDLTAELKALGYVQ
jgi:arylsulfatase A-like enzyme